MTTYEEPDPVGRPPVWLVWTLRMVALMVVTPVQLASVTWSALVGALVRAGRLIRDLLVPVGRGAAWFWECAVLAWRGFDWLLTAAMLGLGRSLRGLARGVWWVLRLCRPVAVVSAWALAGAARLLVPLWAALATMVLLVARLGRPVVTWVAEACVSLAELVAAGMGALAGLAQVVARAVVAALGAAASWLAGLVGSFCRHVGRVAVRVLGLVGRPLQVLEVALREAFVWAAAVSWRVLCWLGRGLLRIYRVTLRPVLRAGRRGARAIVSTVRRWVAPLRRAAAEARASLRAAFRSRR